MYYGVKTSILREEMNSLYKRFGFSASKKKHFASLRPACFVSFYDARLKGDENEGRTFF